MRFSYTDAFSGIPIKTVLGYVPEIDTFTDCNPAYPIKGRVINGFGLELRLQWTVFGEASIGDMFNLVLAPEMNLKRKTNDE